MHSSPRSPPPVSIGERVFTDKLSGSAKTARPGFGGHVRATPGPATLWLSQRSTDSAAPSPKSPAPSLRLVNVESRCVPCAKGFDKGSGRGLLHGQRPT